jgi:hypothetical protein
MIAKSQETLKIGDVKIKKEAEYEKSSFELVYYL